MFCMLWQPASSAIAARETRTGFIEWAPPGRATVLTSCRRGLGRGHAKCPCSSCSWRRPGPGPCPVRSASFALVAAALSASAVFSASLFAGAAGSFAWAASAPIISPAMRTARMRFHDLSSHVRRAGGHRAARGLRALARFHFVVPVSRGAPSPRSRRRSRCASPGRSPRRRSCPGRCGRATSRRRAAPPTACTTQASCITARVWSKFGNSRITPLQAHDRCSGPPRRPRTRPSRRH